MAVYELWDLPSRNLVGTYPTKRQALNDLRAMTSTHGVDYVGDLMLGEEDAQGRSHLIAQGADLIALALASRPEPSGSR